MYGQLIETDKQSHMLGGTFGGTIGYELIYEKTKNENKAFLGAIAGALIVGTLKESYDSTRTNNKFDNNDLIATIGGGIIIGLTINLIKKNLFPILVKQKNPRFFRCIYFQFSKNIFLN